MKTPAELFEAFQREFQLFAHAYASTLAGLDERRHGHFPAKEDVAQEAVVWTAESLLRAGTDFGTKVRSLAFACRYQEFRVGSPAYARSVADPRADRRAIAELHQAVTSSLEKELTDGNRAPLAARVEGKTVADIARLHSLAPWLVRDALVRVALEVERKIEQYRVSGRPYPEEPSSVDIRRVGHERSLFRHHNWHWRDAITYVLVGELEDDDSPRSGGGVNLLFGINPPPTSPPPPLPGGSDSPDEVRRAYRERLAEMGIHKDDQTSRFEGHITRCGKCALACAVLRSALALALGQEKG